MENNRSKFESHGYLINGIAEKLEIQISQLGDAARYQFTIQWSSRGTEVIHGRWQEIHYSKRNKLPIYNNVRQETLFNQLYTE